MLGFVYPGKDNTGLQKKVNLLSDSRFVRGLLKGLLLNATEKLGKNQVISEKICVVLKGFVLLFCSALLCCCCYK